MSSALTRFPADIADNLPALGGPVYWIGNIAYHLPGGSTRITAGSAGVVFYNNAILSETSIAGASIAHWRNNLFLGEESQDMIFSVTSLADYSSSDFNGFRPSPAAAAAFSWRSPPTAALADITDPDYEEQLHSIEAVSLADYSSRTGQDRNSILVDYDIFVNVPQLSAKNIDTVQTLYDADSLDFRLREGASATDKGMPLLTITEGFNGDSPDLGALEYNTPMPRYGPRP